MKLLNKKDASMKDDAVKTISYLKVIWKLILYMKDIWIKRYTLSTRFRIPYIYFDAAR